MGSEMCIRDSFLLRSAFCDLVLRLPPNADQSDTVNFVQKGHNVLITGQAGVGKSEVVKLIIRSLWAFGKNVGVFEEKFENVIKIE